MLTSILNRTNKAFQHKCNASHSHAKSHKHHSHRPQIPPAPIFWERPHFPSWDPNLHYHPPDNYQLDEYYRRQNDYYRYDSDSILNMNKAKLMSSVDANGCNEYCANHFYSKPIQTFCTCEKSASSLGLPMWPKMNQVNHFPWTAFLFVVYHSRTNVLFE